MTGMFVKRFTKEFITASLLVVSLCITSCNEEPIVTGVDNVDAVLATTGQFMRALPRADSGMGFITEVAREGGYNYTSWSHKRNIRHRFDDFPVLYDADTNVYPGSMFRGDSFRIGRYVPIPIARSPITISLDGKDSTVVESPNYARVTSTVQRIVRDQRPKPGEVSINVTPMWLTTDAAFLMLGQQANWLHPQVREKFEVERGVFYANSFMVIRRPHFTIKTTPALVSQSADPTVLRAHVGPDNPPAYASTVEYGRVVLVHFFSAVQQSELDTLLGISIATFRSSSRFSNVATANPLRIRVVALGARGVDAAMVEEFSTMDELSAFVDTYMTMADDEVGVPISIRVHHVHGNAPVALNASADYTIPEWKYTPDGRARCYATLQSIKIISNCTVVSGERSQFYCWFGTRHFQRDNFGGYYFPRSYGSSGFEAGDGDVVIPPADYKEVLEIPFEESESSKSVYVSLIYRQQATSSEYVLTSPPKVIRYPFDSFLFSLPLTFDVKLNDDCRGQVTLKLWRERPF